MMSAHEFQTCGVCSVSQRHESWYAPGATSGTLTMSTILYLEYVHRTRHRGERANGDVRGKGDASERAAQQRRGGDRGKRAKQKRCRKCVRRVGGWSRARETSVRLAVAVVPACYASQTHPRHQEG